MGAGILIDYNDGRPAMEITAGLRAPAYCGELTMATTALSQSGVLTFPAPSTAGSQILFLPTQPVFQLTFGLIPEIYYITGITRPDLNNLTLTFTNKGGNTGRLVRFAGIAMEILATGSSNAGLLVADSTDFTAISNTAALLTCAYRQTVTINGSMALPISGIPFGRWDNPNVSVSFDGGSLIVRDITYSGADDLGGSVTMDLLIFNQSAPQPGPGITMTNNSGAVTFSTVSPPFIYQGQISPSDSAQSIGNGFCQICCTGTQTRMISGSANIRKKGLTMAGGAVRSAYNQVYGNFTTGGFDATFNSNIAMPLCILPGFY